MTRYRADWLIEVHSPSCGEGWVEAYSSLTSWRSCTYRSSCSDRTLLLDDHRYAFYRGATWNHVGRSCSHQYAMHYLSWAVGTFTSALHSDRAQDDSLQPCLHVHFAQMYITIDSCPRRIIRDRDPDGIDRLLVALQVDNTVTRRDDVPALPHDVP